MAEKAIAPIDLLKSLKRVFEHDAEALRREQGAAQSELLKRTLGSRAASAESVVRQIEATLRDWA